MKNQFFWLLISTLFICSCKKNNSDPVSYNQTGFFIVNKGQASQNNSSISYFRKESPYSNVDIYSAINQSMLGDGAQSMSIYNGFGYIIVKNSNKIEVVNMVDFHHLATITGLQSPEYFVGISAAKAYVTEKSSNDIKIINPTTNTVTGTISCGKGPEKMFVTINRVFVCNAGGSSDDSTVTVIDAGADTVISSVGVGVNPNSIQSDINGKLWILCSGSAGPDATWGTSDDTGGSLVQVDPSSLAVLQRFDFLSSEHPLKLAINPDKNKLYYLVGSNNSSGQLYRMNISNSGVPHIPLIANDFIALGIDPLNENIYGANNYSAVSSYAVKYLSNGTFMDTLSIGINPSEFIFNY